MRLPLILITVFLIFLGCQEKNQTNYTISGLEEPVEIIRDEWGINHIYANNQHDLFFAQGYAAAKDRLFQFEIWRRQATGTVAELLGERELKRDIGTRLFKYRGDLDRELNYYHEDGKEIIQAYVDGVNAYIDEAIKSKSLPIEFELLNTVPEKWTPEVVISRHQGLLGNITQELSIGRAVSKIGDEEVKKISWFHPKDPDITLDPAIDGKLLEADILELYNAYRRPVRFKKEDLADPSLAKSELISQVSERSAQSKNDWLMLGSNNWVVSGTKAKNGNTMMANDPHRTIAVPSLRYMVHLVAPGWNVIGGGEPEIPGVSIGHNEHGAWGLTVFRTDGEDLYVYDLNPDNLNQYRYKDEWREMTKIVESIPVKGQEAVSVDMNYTHHGPVTYIDAANLKAYAVRCAWMEPGGAPYLASLRMDQAKSWEEFREACNYSHIPGENMIWAGVDGTIGWQAVGIAPVRKNHSGLVPVPGDGRYEWEGYLPIKNKPHEVNPKSGFIATANQNVTPDDYEHWNAIGFTWSDPYRGNRVAEVLESATSLDINQMKALQTDYLSIPARTLVPYLNKLQLTKKESIAALSAFKEWDFRLTPTSIPATIYIAWEKEIQNNAEDLFLPVEVEELIGIQLTRVIEWIEHPELMFGSDDSRDYFLRISFETAVSKLQSRLGDNMDHWQYGQAENKHAKIDHALGRILNDSIADKFNLGPAPRGGSSTTPNSTGSNYRQSSGASFRLIVDTGDWDATMGTNAPGQSGDPASQFYNNLFDSWAKDEFFPVYFSRQKIEDHKAESQTYQPK